MTTDDFIVEALRNELTQVQSWELYRRFSAVCSENEFLSSWEFWIPQVTTRDPNRLGSTLEAARSPGAQRQIDQLTFALANTEQELRAANDALTAQDETLRMLDDALSIAESLLAEYEEPRVRYQVATGKHLEAA